MSKNHAERFKQLGLNVTYYRKMKDLTQDELAEKVGTSRTHLSNIEAPNMTKSMSLELLFSIAEALDVEPAKLLELR